MCEMQPVHEDGGHLFLKCIVIKDAWVLLNLEHVRFKFVEMQSAKEVVQVVLSMDTTTQTNIPLVDGVG